MNVRFTIRKLLWAVRVAHVRLRFLIVLAAAFLIVGKWDVLRNYWETLTTSMPGKLVGGGVNQDTEYFCPMCPGVISAWPTKCSVCNMPLVRRKKGGAQQLPDGVLARMQISPYRIHLAGIETAAVGYRPLKCEVETHGVVTPSAATENESGLSLETSTHFRGAKGDNSPAYFRGSKVDDSPAHFRGAKGDNASSTAVSGDPDAPQTSAAKSAADETTKIIQAEIHQRHLSLVRPGMAALVVPDVELAKSVSGRVLRVFHEVSPERRVGIEVEASDEAGVFWPGMGVTLRLRREMSDLEPFRSQPADPPALVDGELRKLFTCAEHPDVLRERRTRCPHDDSLLSDLPLTDLERVEWWCPMHPEIVSRERGQQCERCNGMALVPRIVGYRPAGEVLAVPVNAVVDLGERRVVFIERMPGMFDAVEVVVGPRCDGFYPVVSGLAPGQRVAARGAFLLDAETRLNPSVAAGYFGASRSDAPATDPSAPSHHDSSEAAAIRAALDTLSPGDRAAAEKQKTCPITGMPLGSMGTPVKLDIGGKTVWLCCAGCEVEAAENPDQTLEKLNDKNKK